MLKLDSFSPMLVLNFMTMYKAFSPCSFSLKFYPSPVCTYLPHSLWTCNLFFSTMLPTTSPHGNGTLGSRDAARHTAGAKRYKYMRRLLHFRQMDFEFALWQMLYLFTSPQRVYRNFHYRKQTKDQWARDDPAFLVLLSIWLCGESVVIICHAFLLTWRCLLTVWIIVLASWFTCLFSGFISVQFSQFEYILRNAGAL